MVNEYSDYIIDVGESGDPNLKTINKEFPVFTLSFYLFEKNIYAKEVIPALSSFKFKHFGHDMIILHEREIRKTSGAFKGFSKEVKNNFLNELTDIIADTQMTIISVTINKNLLKTNIPFPFEPYAFALELALEQINDFLTLNSQSERKTFIIFESRGAKEDTYLREAFYKKCHSDGYPLSCIFANKQINSNGLQLADLTARPIGNMVIHPDNKNDRTRVILENKFWKGVKHATSFGNGFKVFP